MEAKKKATNTKSGLLKAFCKQKLFSSGMKTDFIPPHPDGLKKDLVLVGRRTVTKHAASGTFLHNQDVPDCPYKSNQLKR